ncbi:MAG: N-acetylneuraminate synthase family protein [Nitrosotalea sp.]
MVFIVAEIGVNWDGDFDLLREMMQAAKDAGCSAIKLQAFLENMIKNHPESTRLIRTSVTKENVSTVDELAKNVGIEWFSTPFYPEAVDFLDPYVKRFKIRELDGRSLIENKPSELVEHVLKTKKEVIVSSQVSPKNTSRYFGEPKIRWLYCVPKYPCSLTDLHFENLEDFDGYSNHHPHVIAPLSAAILGAEIIEVHITSDKSKDFIDNSVSLDYQELYNLIDMINMAKKIIM